MTLVKEKLVLMIQKNYNYSTHCGNKSSKLLTTRFLITIMNVMEKSAKKFILKKLRKVIQYFIKIVTVFNLIF